MVVQHARAMNYVEGGEPVLISQFIHVAGDARIIGNAEICEALVQQRPQLSIRGRDIQHRDRFGASRDGNRDLLVDGSPQPAGIDKAPTRNDFPDQIVPNIHSFLLELAPPLHMGSAQQDGVPAWPCRPPQHIVRGCYATNWIRLSVRIFKELSEDNRITWTRT